MEDIIIEECSDGTIEIFSEYEFIILFNDRQIKYVIEELTKILEKNNKKI